MSALKPIPLSKAKTAYGLLRDVQRAIQLEPLRVNMGVFTADADDYYGPEDLKPACGTVGCFAGWVNILSLGRDAALGRSGGAAKETLGVFLDYRLPAGDRLEDSGINPTVFNAGSGDSCETTRPGTKAHARAVVQRIDRFIKRNEKALRARKLVAAEDGTLSPAPGQD